MASIFSLNGLDENTYHKDVSHVKAILSRQKLFQMPISTSTTIFLHGMTADILTPRFHPFQHKNITKAQVYSIIQIVLALNAKIHYIVDAKAMLRSN